MSGTQATAVPCLSIAVRAWNEEAVIRQSLESVMAQSLFGELQRRGERCEVLCLPNGCTDRTAAVAAEVFAEQTARNPFRSTFTCRVAEMEEAGRNHTWNAFVHEFSHPESQLLFIMDADLVFNEPGTLFNMYQVLLSHPEAQISTDLQIKSVAFKGRKTLLERLSLATTDLTRQIEGQMSGQLYCIRAAVARRLWLPRDLGAPDDGFIKAVVCSDFFTRAVNPARIVVAPHASHIYEAYLKPRDIMRNQKRQMIGQTTAHVLIEYVKSLPWSERSQLADHLRAKEAVDPGWLGRLTRAHACSRPFWRLFPSLVGPRVARWTKLTGWKRLTHFPAALASVAVTLLACALAHRHFRRGQMAYWPKADRSTVPQLGITGS
jgi:hypothetical protein